jgi:hypothetical protein
LVAKAGAFEPTGSERDWFYGLILHLPKCWDGKTLRQTQKGETLTGFAVESETFAVGRESGRF